MKKIEVVCGVLILDGMCLIARRNTQECNGTFEFPGGKVEKGETKEEALIREFEEELEIHIEDIQFLERNIDRRSDKEIDLTCFTCRARKKPTKSNAHSELIWTTPDRIYDYDFFKADQILVKKLQENWECLNLKKPKY